MIICISCKQEKEDKQCFSKLGQCISCYQKEYKVKNKERIQKLNSDYRANNKEQCAEREREWRQKNAGHVSVQKKQYRTENKEKVSAYFVNRYRTDPIYRLKQRCRNQIVKVLKRSFTTKSASTMELLGCTPEQFKQHLESKFQPGMTWENHGQGHDKWHIDHIKPCDSFDLTDPAQQRICFYYTNLQPLWQPQNLAKSNKHI